jgi:predicted dehydrogenase
MPQKQNRRRFIKTSAAVGAGYWVAGGVQPARSESKNEKVQFACIGVDGKGSSDSADAARLGEVVAICDVDERKLNKRAADPRFKNAKKFFDYRTMLDEMGDSFDAVTISTPDHNHAAAGVIAMRMGKHCFCQKPMTHSIYEARVMSELAREKGVATQMGNHGTSFDGLRKAAAVIKSGALGTAKEVHIWTNRPVWPQGIERPTEEPPVPSYLHWEQWLGPAPYRPYHEAYHPFKWRGWWDFGTGALGDMACHTVNMPFMGLNLRDPVSVEAETSGHNNETYPAWCVINFEFPKIGDRSALKMVWYDGGKRPDVSLLEGEEPKASGALVVGDKGKLYSWGDYGENWKVIGVDEPTDIEYPKSPGHFDEWVRAIEGGDPAMSNFPNYAGPLTETILLGNLAVWSGKKVEWDAKNLKATNSPELDSFVKTEYRDGYSL